MHTRTVVCCTEWKSSSKTVRVQSFASILSSTSGDAGGSGAVQTAGKVYNIPDINSFCHVRVTDISKLLFSPFRIFNIWVLQSSVHLLIWVNKTDSIGPQHYSLELNASAAELVDRNIQRANPHSCDVARCWKTPCSKQGQQFVFAWSVFCHSIQVLY